MQMNEITGIEIDYSQLPKNRSSSIHPEAVKYRRAFARANNALEGVILSDTDKKFMDSIEVGMSRADFKKAVLERLAVRRTEK